MYEYKLEGEGSIRIIIILINTLKSFLSPLSLSCTGTVDSLSTVGWTLVGSDHGWLPFAFVTIMERCTSRLVIQELISKFNKCLHVGVNYCYSHYFLVRNLTIEVQFLS